MRIVVGGVSRKCGKTSLVCRLIELAPERRWLAVKVSHHEPDNGAAYQLLEETQPGESGDTRRYLASGAARSYWLRGDLAAGLPELRALLAGAENWIVESTRAGWLLESDLSLVVQAPGQMKDAELLDLLRNGGQEHAER
ncbi:MAG: hypothetical protein HY821_00375 [Acidobacteria bacterium]|nr:hypothetical protein [Acidobacteriota bacterium]